MRGIVIDDLEGIPEKIAEAKLNYPVVIKVQVQIGGRGKAGGVQFADNPAEAVAWAKKLLYMDVRGYTAKQLLIVEKADVAQEMYMSVLLDRNTKCPLLIYSPIGGMDIEQTAKETAGQGGEGCCGSAPQHQNYTMNYIISKTGADPALKPQLTDIAKKLMKAFFEYNTMLVEINPLIVTKGGEVIAVDGKVEVDDNALYVGKLPDIAAYRDNMQEEIRGEGARSFNFHFVPLDEDGTVGIMSNGSGMMMSCLDLITKREWKVEGCLDLRRQASREKLKEAVRIVFQNQNIHVLLVYIFGGITRCDEVCAGIKMALEGSPPTEGSCTDRGHE